MEEKNIWKSIDFASMKPFDSKIHYKGSDELTTFAGLYYNKYKVPVMLSSLEKLNIETIEKLNTEKNNSKIWFYLNSVFDIFYYCQNKIPFIFTNNGKLCVYICDTILFPEKKDIKEIKLSIVPQNINSIGTEIAMIKIWIKNQFVKEGDSVAKMLVLFNEHVMRVYKDFDGSKETFQIMFGKEIGKIKSYDPLIDYGSFSKYFVEYIQKLSKFEDVKILFGSTDIIGEEKKKELENKIKTILQKMNNFTGFNLRDNLKNPVLTGNDNFTNTYIRNLGN